MLHWPIRTGSGLSRFSGRRSSVPGICTGRLPTAIWTSSSCSRAWPGFWAIRVRRTTRRPTRSSINSPPTGARWGFPDRPSLGEHGLDSVRPRSSGSGLPGGGRPPEPAGSARNRASACSTGCCARIPRPRSFWRRTGPYSERPLRAARPCLKTCCQRLRMPRRTL